MRPPACAQTSVAATLLTRKGSAARVLRWQWALLLLTSVFAAPADQVEKFPEGTIVKIEYEGTSIPAEKIKPKLLSRVGQAAQS